MAVSVELTTGADTVLASAQDQTVNAVWQTLNPTDRLDAGAGTDVLALRDGGTFDLGALASLSGFETVTLTNATSESATLRLRDGADLTVVVGNGGSTRTTDADGKPLVNVQLSDGRNSVVAGAENDAFTTSGAASQGTIDGGGGYDILNVSGIVQSKFGPSYHDLTGLQLVNVEELNLSTLGISRGDTVQVKSGNLAGLSKIFGGYLQTSDGQLDLGSATYDSVTVFSTNPNGATFRAHNLSQVLSVQGGQAVDDVVSDVVVPFADREALLSNRFVDRVTDPTGTYTRLVTLDNSSGFVNSPQVTFSGSVDASARGLVRIYDRVDGANPVLIGTAEIRPDRTWSTDLVLPGTEGQVHRISVEVSDDVGNVGVATLKPGSGPFGSLTLDTIPPLVSIALTFGPTSERNIRLDGTVVSQTKNGIDPYGEAGARVQLYDNGVLLSETEVQTNGSWLLNVDLPSYGLHALTARAVDRAGNEGSSSTVFVAAPGIGGEYTTNPDSPGYQVYRLYEAVLGRAPDGLGLGYWTEELTEGGRRLSDIVPGFTGSQEFQSTYGSLDNQGFVTLLYRNVLDRAPDEAGLRDWTGQLAAGASRSTVALGFSESQEFKTKIAAETPQGLWVPDQEAAAIARLYYATLDRAPDEGGLTNWTRALEAGRPLDQIASGFTQSTEFQTRYGALTDAAFVELLYQNVLDRASDAAGRTGWLDALARGASREQVVLGFSESTEFQVKTLPLVEDGILLV